MGYSRGWPASPTAQSLESYSAHLAEAGMRVTATQTHNNTLAEMVQQVRMKLLASR
jgi:hypothetical protein